MTGIASRLRGAVLVAPLALLASCASDKSRVSGRAERVPGVPAPLTTLQAAEVAERHTGGGDARLEIVDDLDNGHLFGVTSGFDASGRPPRESRLLFVYDNGTVRQWPGR